MSDFWIFNFSIFKLSDIGLLWSKIIIFIIEIPRKLHLHTKYWWNNPNSRRCLKSPKFHFLPFLAAQKFIAYTNIQIHVTRLIFIVNWFFLKARNNVLYQNQYQLKFPKNANYCLNPQSTIPISGSSIKTYDIITKITMISNAIEQWTSWH